MRSKCTVELQVAVNSIEQMSVVMETLQHVQFALLSTYKIPPTAVDNILSAYLRLDIKRPILFDFKHIWIFSTDLHKNPLISYFTEVRPVGTRIDKYGRADMMNLTDAFGNLYERF
jgi:hypothetical protein